ncbi:hypothetical protein F965_00100 [Acinetobacter schindleri NIPH 900]|uniref:Uncharacterized protein n=1 Tax=Acinetobacter schindleri NIPH 900 TaxID=1217675 RepID=N8Y095_9GAMM|nr:hypothetical protein [Acinetobacter schindleri]ENV14754.1 hypothetical protein F965_00100 [Acinetobacter schindleri NIPH 900]
MQLPSSDEMGQHKDGVAGSIATLSTALADEYALFGYSITAEDVEIALRLDYAFYAGWATTAAQDSGQTLELKSNYPVSLGEWAVIDPVIRAHCELIQAQRMEATGSLGGERFGLSVSEASQNYMNAKLEMKKEAFVEPPFTLDF